MRKKILGLVIRIGVSAGIIAYIFSKPDTSFSKITAAIADIRIPWLIAALLLYKVGLLIGSYRWQILMRAHGIPVSYRHAVGLNYLGCFFNNFMLSLTGGDVVKAYYASKLTAAKKTEAATIVFIDRMVGFAGLAVMGAVGSLFAVGNAKMHSAMVITLCVVLAFALMAVVGFNKTLARKFGKYVLHPKIREVLKRIYEAVYFYKDRRKVLLGAFGLSIIVWTGLVLMNILLAKGLGVDIPARCYFVFIPVINIISCIPITIAGWGLREQMYKQFFGAVGMDSGVAVSLSMACALIMLAWSLVGGVLYALRLPKLSAHEKPVVSIEEV
jgi:uncharacterized protein (TIRG00374 family)